MEDTIVLKGHFAYMLRVDIDHDEAFPLFNKWKDKYKCTHWIVGLEFGSETGKPHIQGIVWFECLQSMTKLRNYFRNKFPSTCPPGSVAFTSAKKIQNLSKYCMKDGVYKTNLSPSQIESIGKWNVGEGSDYKFINDLYDHIEGLFKKRTDQGQHGYGEEEMVYLLLDFYRLKEKRPNKRTIDYLLWKYHIVSNYDYYHRNYM